MKITLKNLTNNLYIIRIQKEKVWKTFLFTTYIHLKYKLILFDVSHIFMSYTQYIKKKYLLKGVTLFMFMLIKSYLILKYVFPYI